MSILHLPQVELLIIEGALLAELADVSASIQIVLEQDVSNGAVVGVPVSDDIADALLEDDVIVNYRYSEASINGLLGGHSTFSVAQRLPPVAHLA